MGLDYWLVHCRWTIPPALALWLVFRKLRTWRDVYKTLFLITIAVTATIPWDSYLIRNRIWSYPESSVVGPTLFDIPLEEIFFFFVQTYITSSVYALFSRRVVHAVLLPRTPCEGRTARWTGTALFAAVFALAWAKLQEGGEGTYLALIVAWRGTWVIEQGTKLGLSFRDLEIEEAVFFLLTNVMIVFGLAACDYCLAVYDIRSYDTGKSSTFPPLSQFLPILLWTPTEEQGQRIEDLRAAIDILSIHSKSFSTASMVFDGRLRLDLLALYAWCRVCDDLVDNASSVAEAEGNIRLIKSCLDLLYPPTSSDSSSHPERPSCKAIKAALPGLNEAERGSFRLLSVLPITRPPLDELLDGFHTDLSFLAFAGTKKDGLKSVPSVAAAELPIKTDADLLTYANNVASSVADLCVQLVWAHCASSSSVAPSERREILAAARKMGQALQLVNIARDVPADQSISRIYLPARALDTPVPDMTRERRELLERARQMASESRGAIERLPEEARGGIRAACDVYLSIGDAVERALDEGRVHDRARVRKGTRAWTALRAL
ncbi:hypothetical protein Rhopal_003306-T1 [Rhodotorula paludigena]|uniref:Bifunctional lycopene cyclase/phytoene synthase n=1 Tax=Rhodotorula paludigena TaxID=86838 RepID=A0AAV5GJC3_9BASI|nr:hypothetical protein Rhopal_003306-T1 [Rhodotorula paludigena]